VELPLCLRPNALRAVGSVARGDADEIEHLRDGAARPVAEDGPSPSALVWIQEIHRCRTKREAGDDRQRAIRFHFGSHEASSLSSLSFDGFCEAVRGKPPRATRHVAWTSITARRSRAVRELHWVGGSRKAHRT